MARHQRDPKLEKFWRRHLRRQRFNAFNIRAYCRLYYLHESAFYAWRWIIALRDAQAATRVKPARTPTAVISININEKTDSDKPAAKKSTRKPGRPRTAEDIRKLVVQLAT